MKKNILFVSGLPDNHIVESGLGIVKWRSSITNIREPAISIAI